MMAGTLIISGVRTSCHSHCPVLLPSYHLNSLLRCLHTPHAFCSRPRRYPKMEVARRRIHQDSADNKGKSSIRAVGSGKSEHHAHEPSNSHSHSHSHGIFGGHSHSHGHDHDHGGGLMETLQSGGARHSLSLWYRTQRTHLNFLLPSP